MGKLVVTEFITLDGVVQDPGGAEKDEFPLGGWAFQFDRGADGDKFKFDELMAADVQLLGRRTYEGFAKAWPTMNDNQFGQKMNTMPKAVVSTTLENPEWSNTSVLPAVEDVRGLKEQYEGDILLAGSAQLAQSLFALDLVDELHLMVFPVVLGTGKKLFADGAERQPFDLVDTKQTGSVAILTLQRS
jgi:dihydrofolate reductase